LIIKITVYSISYCCFQFGITLAHKNAPGTSDLIKAEVSTMIKLSRREIIEELMRQGVHGLSRIKNECRRFEIYWEERVAHMAC
jgi:hypothetical protein